MRKTIFIYLALLVAFGAAIFLMVKQGPHALAPIPSAAAPVGNPPAAWWTPLLENFHEPLSRLFLQVIVIVLATRLVGALFRRIGQPAVVGEVLAGILLGPSLLGWLSPAAEDFIFPKESLGVLKMLSQIGVCLFMFVVGLELDVGLLRKKAREAVLVSHVSILLPFLLGVSMSLGLYSGYAGPGTSFTSFALFMGIALSITAFPVLARILKERGIERTALGTTAIACAAVDDATAWMILAFVIAIARATSLASTALGLGLVVIYVGVMLLVVRPRLGGWLGVGRNGAGMGGSGSLVTVLLLLLASALATELIGVHGLFGAFVAGVVMPQDKSFREHLTVRMESFSSLFLLPLFFAFSGLRTSVGLLADMTAWGVCLGIIGIATLGKIGGTTVTARLAGMGWNDAFSLGALMNTRGLVELVALNIGFDLGILPPRIFAMMVIMALVTTFMTGPLLNVAQRFRRPLANAAGRLENTA